MIPTYTFVKRVFFYFNGKFFDGKLPIPEFVVSRNCFVNGEEAIGSFSLYYLGLFGWVIIIYGDMELRVSSKYNFSQKCIIETILHEMVHEYISTIKRRFPKDLHGKEFQKMADYLRTFGWNINADVSKDVIRENDEKKEYMKYSVLCAYTTNVPKKRVCVCKISEKKILEYKDKVLAIPGVTKVEFYKCYSYALSKVRPNISSLNGFSGPDLHTVLYNIAYTYKEPKEAFEELVEIKV